MATYIVNSTAGSDSWAGTAASPWRTWRHAVSAASTGSAGSPDLVLYVSGTYSVTSDVTTVSSNVTHAASVARGAVISTTASALTIFFPSAAVNIGLSGLVFQGHSTSASNGNNAFLRFNGGSGHVLYNVEILNTQAHALRMTGGASAWRVQACEIHQENYSAYGKDNIVVDASGTAGSVVDCQIYHGNHVGINVDSLGGATVYASGNTIRDMASHCIGANTNCIVVSASNILYGAGAWNRQDTVDWKHAYFMASAASLLSHHNQLYDHVGAAYGFKDYTGSCAALNDTVYNCNTAGYNESSMIYLNSASTAAVSAPGMMRFQNNVFYHTMAGERAHYFYNNAAGTPAASRLNFGNNLYYFNTGAQTFYYYTATYTTSASWATDRETNSITNSDPLFTDLAGDDYTLQPTSPAINAGSVISGITDGYYGTAPDIGYWEYEPATGGSPTAGESATAVNTSVFGRLVLVIR